MRKINTYLFIPYILWMVLFIVVPVILLVYFSFIDIQGHFGLENYKKLISLKYFKMIWDSVCFAAAITCMTLLISYPAAYFISSSKYQNVWLLIL
ncbi:MAG: ABC transporter permease, partial [Staphylococcus equorum]|nr:ABC transporter permease [Staphylococcus equorum]